MSQEKKTRNKNFTVPNALSALRILIVPFFARTFLTGHTIIASILLGVSGLSDLFDGMIARKFNQVTELGKMLDPFADKLTQGVVALCLGIRFPAILPVLLLFVLKELCMLICAGILLKKKKRPCAAQWYGKVATALFYISAGTIVVMNGFFKLSGFPFQMTSYVLLVITAGMMVYAGVRYFQIFLTILRSDDKQYELDLPEEIRRNAARGGNAQDASAQNVNAQEEKE